LLVLEIEMKKVKEFEQSPMGRGVKILFAVNVAEKMGISVHTFYSKKCKTPGSVPPSGRIGNGRNVWIESEVDEWIKNQIAKSRSQTITPVEECRPKERRGRPSRVTIAARQAARGGVL
jgi:predicted DNA-binding transcriptional regulator AlpA